MSRHDSDLGELMTVDLISLVFIVLLALVSDVRFGTPDPVNDFLERFAHCANYDIASNENVSSEDRATDISDERSALQRVCGTEVANEAIASLSSPEQRVERYSVCTRGGEGLSIPRTNDCDELAVSNLQESQLVLRIDFEEGVIRLPDTFKVDRDEPDGADEAYIDHVIRVLAAMLRQHGTEDGGRFHISKRLTNSELLLVMVEGHTDHQVAREKQTRELEETEKRSERRRLDDNVRLGMRRARYFAKELQALSNEIAIVPTSMGCHRPFGLIGKIEEDPDSVSAARNAGDDRPPWRHDLACVSPDASEQDPRRYVNPEPVQRDKEADFAETLHESSEAISKELARNRRIEIRPIFRLQRNTN